MSIEGILRPAALVTLGLLGLLSVAGTSMLPALELPASQLALHPLPKLNWQLMEPTVREQIEAGFRRVREAGDGASRATLGGLWGSLGQLLQAYELYSAARDCFENATQLLPEEAEWPYYLGQALKRTGQLELAAGALTQALALAPDSSEIALENARLQKDLGHLDTARTLAERVLARRPSAADALLVLAEVATAQLDWQLAVERYEQLLAMQPRATRVYQPLAIAYKQLGQPQKSRELLARRGDGTVLVHKPLLQEIADLRSGTARHLDDGERAFGARDHAGAIRAFELALRADPESYQARMNLGAARLLAGDIEGALSDYESVLELYPDSSETYFSLGVARSRAGDAAGAITAYQEALRLEPTARKPRFNLANVLRRRGDCPAARDYYAALVAADPSDGASRLGEAICLVEEGDHGVARQRLKEALQALPQSVVLANAGARLLAASPNDDVRDGAQALALAYGLLRVEARPEFSETLAMALAETGDFKEAVRVQTSLLESAERMGLSTIIPRLRANLDLYESGRPCRDPAIAEVSVRDPSRGPRSVQP